MNKRTNTFKGEHTRRLRTEVLNLIDTLDSNDWRDGINAIQDILKDKGYGKVKRYHIKKILKDLSNHGFIKNYVFTYPGLGVVMSRGYVTSNKIII